MMPNSRFLSRRVRLAAARAVACAALGACLPWAAQGREPAPAPASRYEGYEAFYRSLGGNLYTGEGQALFMACADPGRQCVWANALRAADALHDDTPQWLTPGGMPVEPRAGEPDIAFDGKALHLAGRRWALRDAVDLAPPSWRGRETVDAEGLASVAAWGSGASWCLEIHHNSSGQSVRYVQVLALHQERLYVLPPLFAACEALLTTPGGGFAYPDNSYVDATESGPGGLRVDYRSSDGKNRVARYRLRYLDRNNPYVFEVVAP